MEEQNKKEVGKNFPKRLKDLSVMIIPFVLVLLIGSFYASHKQNQQITNEVKSALNGQNTDSEYSKILNQVFSYFKQQSENLFQYSRQIDSSNILEAESFVSKNSITQINKMLTNALTELDSYDEAMSKAINGAREMIQNSDLSESQKTEMITGFNKGAGDQESNRLGKARVVAMRNFYEKVLTLYEFMLANFDDYKIQADSSGNSKVLFYSDTNITRYNQIYSDVQKFATEYVKANKEFTDYKDKNFKNDGINVNSEEIQNYFNQ